jgi:hypothetical protein
MEIEMRVDGGKGKIEMDWTGLDWTGLDWIIFCSSFCDHIYNAAVVKNLSGFYNRYFAYI